MGERRGITVCCVEVGIDVGRGGTGAGKLRRSAGQRRGPVARTSAALTVAPPVGAFVVLARHGASFDDRSAVTGSNVGVSSGAPPNAFTAGFDSHTSVGFDIIAQAVTLRDRAVTRNLDANQVTRGAGVITRTRSPFIEPPAPSRPPRRCPARQHHRQRGRHHHAGRRELREHRRQRHAEPGGRAVSASQPAREQRRANRRGAGDGAAHHDRAVGGRSRTHPARRRTARQATWSSRRTGPWSTRTASRWPMTFSYRAGRRRPRRPIRRSAGGGGRARGAGRGARP